MRTWMTDNDPFCCEWLRELVRAGQLDGEVCERDIRELQPSDCTAARCHFFAGIGGWELALRIGGWPGDVPVWTGSCPCQPLSCAGKRRGHADERHLWPAWFRLVRECRPATIFGEQVASRDGLEWLDGILSDLESAGYACAAADLCAAGEGAPHIRQRLYWVANSKLRATGRQRLDMESSSNCIEEEARERKRVRSNAGAGGDTGRLADSTGMDTSDGTVQRGRKHGQREKDGCADGGLGNAESAGPQGRRDRRCAETRGVHRRYSELSGETFWSGARIVECSDGRARRIPAEPEFFPLAHGVPARVASLRGYGNGIVPQVAARFVRAFIEASETGEGVMT